MVDQFGNRIFIRGATYAKALGLYLGLVVLIGGWAWAGFNAIRDQTDAIKVNAGNIQTLLKSDQDVRAKIDATLQNQQKRAQIADEWRDGINTRFEHQEDFDRAMADIVNKIAKRTAIKPYIYCCMIIKPSAKPETPNPDQQ